MADNKEEHSGFEQIKPIAIELSHHRSTGNASHTKKKPKQTLWLGLGFAVLLSTLALVIFLLPRWIEPPALETRPAASAHSPAPNTSTQASGATASPWEQAQQSRMRKNTQAILAKILDAQKALENSGVTVWAEPEYAEAIQHAQAGDTLYNQRDFAAAHTAYQAAMQIMDTLMGQVDEVFKAALEKGRQALDAGDAEAALAAFRVALAIDSIDRDANIGYQRAETLDQVHALIDQGDERLQAQQLQQAKTLYSKALEIDAQSVRAARQIQLAEQKILEREFTKNMSSGFTALDQTQYRQARQFFTAALKLRPKSLAARSALAQTQHSIARLNIHSLLADAEKLEAQERWHEALDKYNAALKLDANLAKAQQGQKRSRTRTVIHDRLERILQSPERLYDQAVHAETLSFYKKLEQLARPGPVLHKQLARLARQLEQAITPVIVSLQSDQLTRVILYRIGELGYFLDKQISLPPGPYVAVGQRDGYKDIRVEFMVDPDQAGSTIKIQAEEKIALRR